MIQDTSGSTTIGIGSTDTSESIGSLPTGLNNTETDNPILKMTKETIKYYSSHKEINTRPFDYTLEVTVDTNNVSYSDNKHIYLELFVPISCVLFVICSFLAFIIYRRYTCICAKKRYGHRLELEPHTYLSNLSELKEITTL